MISVNGTQIACTRFPDGTLSFRYDPYDFLTDHRIVWRYDDDSECMVLWNLVNHIRTHLPEARISLVMPYLPNARMDRVKSENVDEIFTLKWFAKFINFLNFRTVHITDPHSDVSAALIDRAVCVPATDNVFEVLRMIGAPMSELVLCFPDDGSKRKYSKQLTGMEYVFGIKDREWRSGKIKSLTINKPEVVRGRTVLIVDDICSRGRTFVSTAQVLKDAGADKIYLYITHCENSIFDGEVLTSGLIEHVYTTDSIYRGEHEMISVLKGMEEFT